MNITVDMTELKKLLKHQEEAVRPIAMQTLQTLSLIAESEIKKRCPTSHAYTTGGKWGQIVGKIRGGGYVVKGDYNTAGGGVLKASFGRYTADNIYKEDANKLEITLGSKLKYADAIVGNTRPYTIRPKNKKYLYFAVSMTTALLKKKVTHPGGLKLTGSGGRSALDLVAADVMKRSDGVLQQIIQFNEAFK